jgi:hypothetical protein
MRIAGRVRSFNVNTFLFAAAILAGVRGTTPDYAREENDYLIAATTTLEPAIASDGRGFLH